MTSVRHDRECNGSHLRKAPAGDGIPAAHVPSELNRDGSMASRVAPWSGPQLPDQESARTPGVSGTNPGGRTAPEPSALNRSRSEHLCQRATHTAQGWRENPSPFTSTNI